MNITQVSSPADTAGTLPAGQVSRFLSSLPSKHGQTGREEEIDRNSQSYKRKEGTMKKWFLAILLLLTSCLIPAFTASAATQSSDTMIMEWTAQRVWVDKGELLMRGTFKNKRSDLSITKVNEFTTQITFTRIEADVKYIPYYKVKEYENLETVENDMLRNVGEFTYLNYSDQLLDLF